MSNEEIAALYQIGGAFGVVVVGAILAIFWVMRTVKAMGVLPPKIESTKIITTDSIAMQGLAATLEASNTILTENNLLRREEHKDRERNRASLDANTEALEANTKAVERVGEIVRSTQGDIRELTREIVRGGRG